MSEDRRPPTINKITGGRNISSLTKLLMWRSGSWHVGSDPRDSEMPVFIAREGYSREVRDVEEVDMCRDDDGHWRRCLQEECQSPDKCRGVVIS